MAYTIQYGTSKYDVKKVDKKKRQLIVSICLLCVVVLICATFYEQVGEFRRHFLPFLEPNVQDAFRNMAVQVENGMEIKDAASAFCREILFETEDLH